MSNTTDESPCPGSVSISTYNGYVSPPGLVKKVWARDPSTGKLAYVDPRFSWIIGILCWSRILDRQKILDTKDGSLRYKVSDDQTLVVIPGEEKISAVRLTDTHSTTEDKYSVINVWNELAAPDQDVTDPFIKRCVEELIKRGIRRPIQELFITAGRKILWLLVVDGQVKIMTQDGKYFLLPHKKTLAFNGFSITVL